MVLGFDTEAGHIRKEKMTDSIFYDVMVNSRVTTVLMICRGGFSENETQELLLSKLLNEKLYGGS